MSIHQNYRITARPFIRITESQTRRCIRILTGTRGSYSFSPFSSCLDGSFGFFPVDIQKLFLVRKLVVMVLLEDIIIFLNIHCLRERQTQGCRDKSAPSLVLNINVHFTSLFQCPSKIWPDCRIEHRAIQDINTRN